MAAMLIIKLLCYRRPWLMDVLRLIRKLACLNRSVCLSGIALLMNSSIALADSAQLENTQQVYPTPVWIQDPYSGDSVLTMVRPPDQSLWNAKRIEDYQASLKIDTAPPLGVLTIEKLNIQVPIYNGTSDFILDRGAGRIKGMARMDEDGNLGISGHRDGFFRAIKDIQLNDDILIQTTRGVEKYAVSNINIVPKSDVSVLSKTDEKTLTIVTCYPFYFVGHAPKRFIVTAIPRPDDILDQAE
jgi:LPXTG-site transpeptidase (sortase) family protein